MSEWGVKAWSCQSAAQRLRKHIFPANLSAVPDGRGVKARRTILNSQAQGLGARAGGRARLRSGVNT